MSSTASTGGALDVPVGAKDGGRTASGTRDGVGDYARRPGARVIRAMSVVEVEALGVCRLHERAHRRRVVRERRQARPQHLQRLAVGAVRAEGVALGVEVQPPHQGGPSAGR